jgi:hypothetical protein
MPFDDTQNVSGSVQVARKFEVCTLYDDDGDGDEIYGQYSYINWIVCMNIISHSDSVIRYFMNKGKAHKNNFRNLYSLEENTKCEYSRTEVPISKVG